MGGRGIQLGLVEARTGEFWAGSSPSGLGAGCQDSGLAWGVGIQALTGRGPGEGRGRGTNSAPQPWDEAGERPATPLLSPELWPGSVRRGGEGPRWGQAAGFWGWAVQLPPAVSPGIWHPAGGQAPWDW